MGRKRMTLKDTRYKTLKTWLRAAIWAVANAEIAYSWRGSRDADDIPAIDAELDRSHAELKDVLAAIDDVVDRDLKGRFPV